GRRPFVGTWPCSFLLRSFSFFFARPALAIAWPVAAVTTVATIKSVASIEPVAPIPAIATPFVTVAIAFGAAHHGRRPLFVLLDPDGQVAQDLFIEPLQPLDLIDRRRWRVDVHQGEMRLAVLAQAVGERFDAPRFSLGDGAAEALDDALELRGQFLDLLRAGVLARKIDVFVERHGCPFLKSHSAPRRHAPRALRERLECSDGGDTGRRTIKALPRRRTRPSVQPPAGVERKPEIYARSAERQAGRGQVAVRLRRLSGLHSPSARPGSFRQAAPQARSLRAFAGHRRSAPAVPNCAASSPAPARSRGFAPTAFAGRRHPCGRAPDRHPSRVQRRPWHYA